MQKENKKTNLFIPIFSCVISSVLCKERLSQTNPPITDLIMFTYDISFVHGNRSLVVLTNCYVTGLMGLFRKW